MGKLEFTFWILTVLGITYLQLTVFAGFISDISTNAINEINAVNPTAFTTTTAALKYWPLALYLIPAAWLFKALINKWVLNK